MMIDHTHSPAMFPSHVPILLKSRRSSRIKLAADNPSIRTG